MFQLSEMKANKTIIKKAAMMLCLLVCDRKFQAQRKPFQWIPGIIKYSSVLTVITLTLLEVTMKVKITLLIYNKNCFVKV